MSIAELTTFLGWLSVINIGVLLFSTTMVVLFRDFAANIHAKMFSISKDDVPFGYFQYLAQYKTLTLIFNLAPYVALKVMF